MANIIQAVLTNDGREALAKSFGAVSGTGYLHSYGLLFQIGTGGYHDPNPGVPEPVTPDPSLHNLQAQTSGIFFYQKTFLTSDVLFISPSTIQFRCFLDLAEANGLPETDTSLWSDGAKNTSSLGGNAPVFYEIGIFDPQHKMIAYGTFPGETKLNTKTLNHLVSVNF